MWTRRPRSLALVPALLLAVLAVAALALLGANSALARNADKPAPDKPHSPESNQIIAGYPLTITVEDDTRMHIQYRDLGNQFFGGDAEGAFMWAVSGGVLKVFGPNDVSAGNTTNLYTPVSNTRTGSGTPSDPWVITTVVTVPGTNLRLTQRVTYVNGAEFCTLSFQTQQVGGTGPVNITLFHAADLYTAGSDQGYGYYDPTTGGVGDYFTVTHGILNGTRLYQQFVPASTSPASFYEEHYWGTFWDLIGSTSGPGPGFNNTIDTTLHDAAAGLQWNLSIPAGGSVTVGDTDQFSPHASTCGSFSDVPYGSYYYEYVYYLACHGYVSGYADTTFRPNNPATRGQLSKIIVLAEGWPINTTGGPHFTDVPPSNAFYTYIETAYNRGIISGYADGTFRWGNNVTRGQAVKIIVGARGWPINTTGGPHFSDVPTTNAFYNFVETAYNRGVIGGYSDGTFRPNNSITRAQLSKVLYLALNAP